MEVGEGLIDARAAAGGGSGGGGVELSVRLVNDRTCFVALPQPILASLMAAAPVLPLPLALNPRAGGRPGHRGGAGGAAAPRQPVPCFVAWAGPRPIHSNSPQYIPNRPFDPPKHPLHTPSTPVRSNTP